MRGLFVDSSAWCAAANRNDRHNRRAKEILQAEELLVTTDHILVESWWLLRRSLSRKAADRFWEGLLQGVAVVEVVTLADVRQAWDVNSSFPDQGFSLVDLTSFVVMERLGLHRAASFDNDFVIYRYGQGRDRAFEVAR